MPQTLTYKSYLELDSLLSKQIPASEEHDESLFIITHQTYELWFKQFLHEGKHLTNQLNEQKEFEALATLKRVLKILKVLVSQVDILETMTPLSFLSFRDRLASSSGFQSCQFRCVEFFLGIKSKEKLEVFKNDPLDYLSLIHI